jgi:hypothetical protein
VTETHGEILEAPQIALHQVDGQGLLAAAWSFRRQHHRAPPRRDGGRLFACIALT